MSSSLRAGGKGRRSVAGVLAVVLALLAVAAHADGLVLHAEPLKPGLQVSEPPGSWLSAYHPHFTPSPIRAVGDYYFFDDVKAAGLGSTFGSVLGGLRASTGFAAFGQPSGSVDPAFEPVQTLPYLGLGYTHLWFNSQLSVNADFGLASQNLSAASRLRGLAGGSSLDDVTRDLRWAPVMAVNVSYAF